MIKYIYILILIIFVQNVNAQEGNGARISFEIDSIVYSKNDGFFEYTLLDVFIAKTGGVYVHELSKNLYKIGGKVTQIGGLRKSKLYNSFADSLFDYINREDFIHMPDSFMLNKSDQVTRTTKFYSKGELIKVISDYGGRGNIELRKLYKEIDRLVEDIENWSIWDFQENISLVENISVDSIKIIEHKKSKKNYYRNGVKKSVTLVDRDIENFVAEMNNSELYIPYETEPYTVLTSKTDRYSIVLFIDGQRINLRYDGKRIMKNSFLHYSTKKNIVKSFF